MKNTDADSMEIANLEVEVAPSGAGGAVIVEIIIIYIALDKM